MTDYTHFINEATGEKLTLMTDKNGFWCDIWGRTFTARELRKRGFRVAHR